MTDLQFYPTPKALAEKLWAGFERPFKRPLDACAGDGDLADSIPRDYYGRHALVDCIEIDAARHPTLRAKHHRVVGLDFLAFEGGAVYDCVVLNPPFANGVKHALKAWDMLFTGQVGAILNAETLRNPFSAERQRLLALVQQHGKVEFIADAFRGCDVVREANVEVALVHLYKPAECSEDWIGPVIASMTTDPNRESDLELPRELALPNSFVSNQVNAFRAAVKAMREAVKMRSVAEHYAARIGGTMCDLANRTAPEDETGETVRERLEKGYIELKDRAWASVLRSTEALNKLSAKVQRQAESEFEAIKCLEFSESNVYAFLLGLVQSAPEMQLDMACDVFDQVMQYHSDNAVFYRGWKSNDRHRSCGMRIKTTRFILPRNSRTFGGGLDWDAVRRLSDFDKVFALLDGKPEPEVSLVSLFEGVGSKPRELARGARVSSSYFDIRWYPGAGTIHFFPRSKELVDRLNRLVGRQRGWLPRADEPVPDAFWVQFDKAEKFDRELREETDRIHRNGRSAGLVSSCDHPFNRLMRRDPDEALQGQKLVGEAIDIVLERHGLLAALEHDETQDAPRLCLTV